MIMLLLFKTIFDVTVLPTKILTFLPLTLKYSQKNLFDNINHKVINL